MPVFDPELWMIGLGLKETIEKRDILQRNGVKMVTVFSDSQGAIRRAADLEPGPGQQLARRINRKAQALLAYGIETVFPGFRNTLVSPGTKKQTARRT
jgi:hypothetical protein